MEAPGETDLTALLAGLDVVRRPGTFGYVERAADEPPPPHALAMIDEGGTVAYVVPAAADTSFPAAWLTLTVHSSLDAVGLTAAVSTALAAAGIPANVLAGLRHDHVLVPADLADRAVAVLRALKARSAWPAAPGGGRTAPR